jgi:hypothetical protein
VTDEFDVRIGAELLVAVAVDRLEHAGEPELLALAQELRTVSAAGAGTRRWRGWAVSDEEARRTPAPRSRSRCRGLTQEELAGEQGSPASTSLSSKPAGKTLGWAS